MSRRKRKQRRKKLRWWIYPPRLKLRLPLTG